MKRRDLIRSLLSVTAGVAAIPLSNLVQARIGRPATPASVAGVRRRTRRRTRRRVVAGMTLMSLPYGCGNQVMRAGMPYYYCGGIWYRPTYQGTTVVYVVDEVEAGADTNVEFEE